MPITNYNCLCISEILHLFRSQLIIDFPFIHSKFVNDSMLAAVFFSFPFHCGRHPRFAFNARQFSRHKHFSLFPESGISLAFCKHLQSQDELIKGQYVACIIIYLDQHLSKYEICHFSILQRVT